MTFKPFTVSENFLPLYQKPEDAKCFLCFGKTTNPQPSGYEKGDGAWKADCNAAFHGHQITFFDLIEEKELSLNAGGSL